MRKSDKTRKNQKSSPKNPQPGKIAPEQKKQNADAFRQADKDMEHDAQRTAHSKNDDLDEGETAILGKDKNDLV